MCGLLCGCRFRQTLQHPGPLSVGTGPAPSGCVYLTQCNLRVARRESASVKSMSIRLDRDDGQMTQFPIARFIQDTSATLVLAKYGLTVTFPCGTVATRGHVRLSPAWTPQQSPQASTKRSAVR